MSPPRGFSILMTRAPRSPRVRVHSGAETACSSATTVVPANGPAGSGGTGLVIGHRGGGAAGGGGGGAAPRKGPAGGSGARGGCPPSPPGGRGGGGGPPARGG